VRAIAAAVSDSMLMGYGVLLGKHLIAGVELALGEDLVFLERG